ncbi:alpha/beta hydrolase [uncultured Sphingomonas sp.]|uniref:alpha/beta hydrolase n=1 Tax=uncultured Sphingomonas sp. TaxID=158754 RepID=UPI0035C9D1E8
MTHSPRPALAYHLTEGAGTPLLFLPGYASDMTGTKALALEAWARGAGHGFLRFDYAGCGQSEGVFAEQTLTGWRDDALAMLGLLGRPAILVGSSMGGWLMLMLARDHPDLVAGLVGIAIAPDFTDWGFTTDEKMRLLTEGQLERASPYGPDPTVYTRAFWSSGEASRMTFGRIAIGQPVRLIHGMADPHVPWVRSAHVAGLLDAADVQTLLVEDGDHRLSRDADIALLIRAVEDLVALASPPGASYLAPDMPEPAS